MLTVAAFCSRLRTAAAAHAKTTQAGRRSSHADSRPHAVRAASGSVSSRMAGMATLMTAGNRNPHQAGRP